MRGNDLLFNYGFRYPPPFQSKKEPGFANQLQVLKMRKLWSHDAFLARKSHHGMVGKRVEEKVEKGKRHLSSAEETLRSQRVAEKVEFAKSCAKSVKIMVGNAR